MRHVLLCFRMNLFPCLHLPSISERLFNVHFGFNWMIASFLDIHRLQFLTPPRRCSVRATVSQLIVKSTLLRLPFLSKCILKAPWHKLFVIAWCIWSFSLALLFWCSLHFATARFVECLSNVVKPLMYFRLNVFSEIFSSVVISKYWVLFLDTFR